MKVLFSYVKRTLQEKKGRTIMTILGIILSFALFTAVLAGVSSGIDFMQRYAQLEYGNWHGMIFSPDDEHLNTLKSDSRVEQILSLQNLGSTVIEMENKEESITANICGIDSDFADAMNIYILTGRLPEKEDEIILPEKIDKWGIYYKLGETITLNVDTDVNSETMESMTFTVVGFFKESGYNFEKHFYTCRRTGNYSEDVYFTTNNMEDAYDILEHKMAGLMVDVNQELFRYYGKSRDSVNITTMIHGFAAILAGLIAFVSVSLIYNAFSISLTERTRQIGLLKSIGATKKQIWNTVWMEAGIMCAIAIPLGILLGCGACYLALLYLRPQFLLLQGEGIKVEINFVTKPSYILAASLAGIITVIISAAIPAIRANRMTPIECIRQKNDIKLSEKKLKGGWLGSRIFGIAGTLSSKYAKRSKKTYRGICFSVASSLILFICGGGLVCYMKFFASAMLQENPYDLTFIYNDFAVYGQQAEDLRESLKASESLSDNLMVVRQQVYMDFGSSEDMDFGMKKYLSQYQNYSGFVSAIIYYFDDNNYLEIIDKLGLSREEYYDGDNPKMIGVNYVSGSYYNEQGKRKTYAGNLYKKGTSPEIKLWVPPVLENSVSIYFADTSGGTIGYYFNNYEYSEEYPREDVSSYFKNPVGTWIDMEDAPGIIEFQMPVFISSIKSINNMGFTSSRTYLYVNASKDTDEAILAVKDMAINEELPRYNYVYNRQEEANLNIALMSIINVFLMCFVVVLCLIALSNVANSVTTAVNQRGREYAMLLSMGMGKGQMVRFLILENMSYSLKALIIGLLVSMAVNYYSFKAMTEALETAFFLPVFYYVVAIVSVFALVAFTVIYTLRKNAKMNICDQLKAE